jgi:hypothetical protein
MDTPFRLSRIRQPRGSIASGVLLLGAFVLFGLLAQWLVGI